MPASSTTRFLQFAPAAAFPALTSAPPFGHGARPSRPGPPLHADVFVFSPLLSCERAHSGEKSLRHFLSINHSAPGNVFTGTSFPSCHSISQLRKNITVCSLLSLIFYPCNELIEHLGPLLACTCVPARPSPRSNFLCCAPLQKHRYTHACMHCSCPPANAAAPRRQAVDLVAAPRPQLPTHPPAAPACCALPAVACPCLLQALAAPGSRSIYLARSPQHMSYSSPPCHAQKRVRRASLLSWPSASRVSKFPSPTSPLPSHHWSSICQPRCSSSGTIINHVMRKTTQVDPRIMRDWTSPQDDVVSRTNRKMDNLTNAKTKDGRQVIVG